MVVRPFALAAFAVTAVLTLLLFSTVARADTLIGTTTPGTVADEDAAGTAEAFKLTAAAAGTVDHLSLFVDATSKATKLQLGLYADSGGHPGALLVSGAASAPVAGWNSIAVPATPVAAGTTYWAAALGTGGKLSFREGTGSATPAENHKTTTLTALPATWTTGPKWSGGTPSFAASSAAIVPPDGPDQVGQWGSLMNWPIVGVQSVLMTNGKMLELDGWIAPSPGGVYDQHLGGIPDGGFLRADNPLGLDVFCSGNVTLPDGRVLLVGGHGFTATIGLKETTIYDPGTETWSLGPKMQYARWYPTATELADGRILALSGNITQTTWADTPEIYDPATDKWSTLSSISTSQVHEIEYPLTFLLPDGKVFTIATSVGKSFVLDAAAPSWTSVGATSTRNGSAVMYRPGKILLTGGGTPLTSNNPAQKGAETIDMTAANPTWKAAAPMGAARYAHKLTMLPDGKVLAIGGGGNMNQEDLASGELTSEEWDPDTGVWTKTATMPVPRLYHSTAVLQPDGRVLVAGGGHAEGPQSPSEYNAQFYSPSYLFKGARPTITSAPSTATYGSSIDVATPDASSIASVSLVNLGADTHTLDMNQHFVPLSFTKGGGALHVDVPSTPALAPPGTYMLFIVNDKGVPSIAPFITVTPSSTPPSVAITAPAGGSVSGTVPLAATASDTTGIASVQFTVDGNPVGPKLTSAPYTYNWDSTGLSNGSHAIGAVATSAGGTKGTATPVTVTTNNVGLLSPTVDAQVSTEGKGNLTSPAITTAGGSDVLIAFVTSDGPASGQAITITGGGLTWSLVKRVTAVGGSTEIWKAKASAPLTGATVTATQGKAGYNQSLTVVAFAGASGVGASATANAKTGAPTVSLTSTVAGSLVYGAGNDYDRAVARTPGAGQAIVHQWLDTAIGDSYWVQNRTAAISAPMTTATISDSAPTNDSWNLAAVEVVP
jgi:hypothetical protein